MIMPLNKMILISDFRRAEHIEQTMSKKLPGFKLGKLQFEGLPNVGTVHAVPENEKTLKPGMRVVFIEMQPKAFRIFGKSLLPVHRDNIAGVLK